MRAADFNFFGKCICQHYDPLALVLISQRKSTSEKGLEQENIAIYIIQIGTVSLESAIVHLPLMFHKNGQYIFRNSLIHFFLQELIYFYFRSCFVGLL